MFVPVHPVQPVAAHQAAGWQEHHGSGGKGGDRGVLGGLAGVGAELGVVGADEELEASYAGDEERATLDLVGLEQAARGARGRVWRSGTVR